jgi:hypothetical protein
MSGAPAWIERVAHALRDHGPGEDWPVAGLLPVFGFFLWVALRQALRNDRLVREGRESEIEQEMGR